MFGGDLSHSTFTHRKNYTFEGDSGGLVLPQIQEQERRKEGEGPFGPIFSAVMP